MKEIICYFLLFGMLYYATLSSLSNYVDLLSNQSISGAKYFNTVPNTAYSTSIYFKLNVINPGCFQIHNFGLFFNGYFTGWSTN